MLLLLLFQLNFLFATEKYNVCSITINSDDEIKAFKKHLDPKDFNFVELTDVIDPAAKAKKDVPADWFDAVCEKDVRCDVVLISGHFGGSFFGESGIDLPLERLEEASCSNKCHNILSSAQEVFLFGCNTLATKEKDHRTPEMYLQALVDDGIDRTQAERIVQARYGALGDSFKDRMQRVFEKVPNIYGFDSVGPAGNTIQPFLNKYFSEVGDYKQHLLTLQTKGLLNTISAANKINKSLHNVTLAKVLASTAYAECAGITESDPAYRIKKEICKFYDDNLSTEDKVAMAEALLTTDDALLYIPTIAAYFSKNDSEALKALKDNAKIRALLEKLAKDLEGSPGVLVDMLNLQLSIGFISESEWTTRVKDTLKKYVKKMDRSSADVICSIMEPEENYEMEERMKKISFNVDEMNLSQLTTKAGLEALMCINVSASSEDKVSKELLKLKDQKRNDEHQTYYFAALLQRTTPEDLKLTIPLAKAEFVRVKNPEYKMGLQMLLAEAYGKIQDMKGLEELYQSGDLYAEPHYDTRWQLIEQAAKMNMYSAFYEKKALEHSKKFLASDEHGSHFIGEMLGAIRDETQVRQFIESAKSKDMETIKQMLDEAMDEDEEQKQFIIHPLFIDLYIDRVVFSTSENVYPSPKVYKRMSQEQLARVRKYAEEHKNTPAVDMIEWYLGELENEEN